MNRNNNIKFSQNVKQGIPFQLMIKIAKDKKQKRLMRMKMSNFVHSTFSHQHKPFSKSL